MPKKNLWKRLQKGQKQTIDTVYCEATERYTSSHINSRPNSTKDSGTGIP